ncbi:MAG: hypothetical protein AAFR98_12140 [Pseudomonadota bacterium]
MKVDISTVAAALIGALTAGSAIAGSASYICSIEGFHVPDHLGEAVAELRGQDAQRSAMTIDRETGRVIHSSLGNTSFNQIRVLNPGSSDWSFKVMADSGQGGHIRYYEVAEYVEGPTKPLIIVADGASYWGQCQ